MDQYVELSGGLDLETPPVTVGAGTAIIAENVYESVKGGYTTVGGYERFDGQARPSDQSYSHAVLELIALGGGRTMALDGTVGDTVTYGGNPWNIQYSINDSVDGMVLLVDTLGTSPPPAASYPITLTFNDGSTYYLRAFTPIGGPTESYEVLTKDQYILIPQNQQRALIAAPVGSDEVTGIKVMTNGDVLCHRDNGAVSSTYRQFVGIGGWSLASTAEVYNVTIGQDDRAVPGDTFNTAAQVVMGVFNNVVAGVPTSPETQCIYVIKNTAAPLAAAATLTQDIGGASAGVIVDQIPWEPVAGGRQDHINYNFYAGLTTDRVYYADGINCPMYYDPIQHVVVPIFTSYNEMLDVSSHVAEYQSRLIASTNYGGFITSVTGEPDLIDGTLGSIEVGVGGVITAFSKISANLLAIFTATQTWGLEGTTVETWQFRLLTDSSGSKPFTVTKLDQVFSGDDVGIVQISRTDTLGGMQSSTITNNMQGLYSDLAKNISCSTSLRSKAQMRYFFDEECVVASRIAYQSANGNDTVRYGMSTLKLDHTIICVSTGEDSFGKERTYFGCDDGYVYEMDIGTTFDGQSINSTLTLNYNHLGGTSQKKRFEGITVEARANGPTTVQIWHNLNDGTKTYNERDLNYENGGSALYNKALFGEAQFNAETLGRVKSKLKGTGFNIQIVLNRDSVSEEQITFTGYSLRFTPRGKVTL